VDELERPVAEVDDADRRERFRGRLDPGGEHLAGVRVGGVGGVPLLGARPGLDRRGRGLLVREQRDRGEARPEHRVAEGVVEVRVGVDHRDHLVAGHATQRVEDLAHRPLGGVGVHDDEATLSADDCDVDVEPGVPGHPDPVGDLGEPLVGDEGRSRHGGSLVVTC
jgi:hypothetical protein